MRSPFEKLKNTVEMELFDSPKITGEELRVYISEVNMLHARRNPPGVKDEEIEKNIAEITEGAKLLLDKSFSFDDALKVHLNKIADGYDINKFSFWGGIKNLQ